jgi:hypothetical protein
MTSTAARTPSIVKAERVGPPFSVRLHLADGATVHAEQVLVAWVGGRSPMVWTSLL